MPIPHTLFGGKYRTVRPLGEGGMGTVFEVENVLTQKRAAIKWLHPRFQSGPDSVRRMLREARAMARIRHQNVVDVYDVLLEDNDICLVMELLQGELLSERLARASVSMANLLALLLPAMRGVAAAHAVGVVHRDIKPENIFLVRENDQSQPTPKVIDFGISKVFNGEEDPSTCSGVTMGTPRYVSYEQLRGLRDVDGRTDTYAFGVILFEALTGRAPYQADTLGQQAIQFVTSVPPTVRSLRPEVPEALASSVERAISRDRDQRSDSLGQLVEELTPFMDTASYPQALNAFPPVPVPQPVGGHPLAMAWETTSEASGLRFPRTHPAPSVRSPGNRRLGIVASVLLVAGLAATLLMGRARTHADRAEAKRPVVAASPKPMAAATPTVLPDIAPAPALSVEIPELAPSEPTPSLVTGPLALPGPTDDSAPRPPRARRGAPEAALERELATGASAAAPVAAEPATLPEPVTARSGRLSRSEF
ncbi:MAG: protein kinase [Myxococcales bacterium]